jgi:hypothetical protein
MATPRVGSAVQAEPASPRLRDDQQMVAKSRLLKNGIYLNNYFVKTEVLIYLQFPGSCHNRAFPAA